jgi:hypothetical protein
MKPMAFLKKMQFALFALLLLASCTKADLKDLFQNPKKPPTNTPAVIFYALAADGMMLDKFSTANPEKVQQSATITGLQSGERILAIDFRPATGQLYGLGSTSRLYVINPETGMARVIGSGPFTPALAGTLVGFDFNPVIDRIRVVTNTGQNLVINPETGTVAATATAINGQPGAMIAAVAYTNNFAGATTTTLFDIDVASDKLFRQDPPNAGTLVEVGDLKLNVEGEGGFDISPNGIAVGLFEVNKKTTLFTVDLNTGMATVLKKADKNTMYIGIAIPTNPVAYAMDAMNNLLIFNPANPSAVISKPITGLQSGETVLGIDFRPLNGQLYAMGSTGRIYTLTFSATAAPAALAGTLTVPLSGTAFGFDFNPVVDQIRIVSNTGQNLRFVPATGATAMDSPLNPGSPAVTAAAYTNNFAGATTTMLFDIDTNTDRLYQQTPPGAGTLVDKGPLGVNAEAMNGFDIGGTSGIAYAALTAGGSTRLYRINLENGMATAIGNLTSAVNGFTVGLGF